MTSPIQAFSIPLSPLYHLLCLVTYAVTLQLPILLYVYVIIYKWPLNYEFGIIVSKLLKNHKPFFKYKIYIVTWCIKTHNKTVTWENKKIHVTCGVIWDFLKIQLWHRFSFLACFYMINRLKHYKSSNQDLQSTVV